MSLYSTKNLISFLFSKCYMLLLRTFGCSTVVSVSSSPCSGKEDIYNAMAFPVLLVVTAIFQAMTPLLI